MCETDYAHHHDHGGGGLDDLPIVFSVIGWFFLGLFALLRAAWWIIRHLAAPLTAAVAVATWRWTTGALLLPERHRAGAPLFRRHVRAVGRNLLTLALAGSIVAPLATAITTVAVVTAAITTVIVVRTRTARRGRPRPVHAATGIPVRGPAMRRDPAQLAITDTRTDVTWTEQSVRDAAGRVA
jgi:hypothetical protein